MNECRAGESGRGGRERNPSVTLRFYPVKLGLTYLILSFRGREKKNALLIQEEGNF